MFFEKCVVYVAKKAIFKGEIVAEAINGVRDFAIEPSNYLTPAEFGERIKKRAKEISLQVEVLGEGKIRSLKMGALLGVAQGSAKEPKFIVLKYAPRGAKKHVCLVGKGVTFDTGGTSLKPSSNMHKMKYDMIGGATVVHALMAIAQLKVPTKVTALVPLTDNAPGRTAINPGDILTSMSGLTIEVLNTDAEGRLILADALHYAKKLKPNVCIDVATLTGAVSVALGDQAFGIMGNDDRLVSQIVKVSEQVEDRCWPLPIWEYHREVMKGDICDLRNISTDGKAGTVTAGAFLSFFSEGMKWAHFDIAGAAWKDKGSSYLAPGPSGASVRTLVNWVETIK